MPFACYFCKLPDCQAQVQAGSVDPGLDWVTSSTTSTLPTHWCCAALPQFRCRKAGSSPAWVRLGGLPNYEAACSSWPCCCMRVPSSTVIHISLMWSSLTVLDISTSC